MLAEDQRLVNLLATVNDADTAVTIHVVEKGSGLEELVDFILDEFAQRGRQDVVAENSHGSPIGNRVELRCSTVSRSGGLSWTRARAGGAEERYHSTQNPATSATYGGFESTAQQPMHPESERQPERGRKPWLEMHHQS